MGAPNCQMCLKLENKAQEAVPSTSTLVEPWSGVLIKCALSGKNSWKTRYFSIGSEEAYERIEYRKSEGAKSVRGTFLLSRRTIIRTLNESDAKQMGAPSVDNCMVLETPAMDDDPDRLILCSPDTACFEGAINTLKSVISSLPVEDAIVPGTLFLSGESTVFNELLDALNNAIKQLKSTDEAMRDDDTQYINTPEMDIRRKISNIALVAAHRPTLHGRFRKVQRRREPRQ